MRKLVFGVVSLLMVSAFAPAPQPTTIAQEAQRSLVNTCPNPSSCLLNCPFKFTNPEVCELICQNEICDAP